MALLEKHLAIHSKAIDKLRTRLNFLEKKLGITDKPPEVNLNDTDL